MPIICYLRTSLSNFSFQPFEMVWIFGGKQRNGRSETSVQKATAREKGLGDPIKETPGSKCAPCYPPASGPRPS